MDRSRKAVGGSRLDLLEGERPIVSGNALHAAWWQGNPRGKLCLTNGRLLFVPFGFHLVPVRSHSWRHAEIEGFGLGKPSVLAVGVLWLEPWWYIRVAGKRVHFKTRTANDWIEALSKATGLTADAGDGQT
jgi:hypothetical protein